MLLHRAPTKVARRLLHTVTIAKSRCNLVRLGLERRALPTFGWRMALSMIRISMLVAAGLMLLLGAGLADAHEGHDHDKPPPLNLPVAPRVVAVTPELELVGVLSGKDRLTVFLHGFATNEPVRGASLTVKVGDNSAVARPEGDGVFTLTAPWIAGAEAVDLVFSLTLNDGTQDLLTGRLQLLSAAKVASAPQPSASLQQLLIRPELFMAAGGGLIAGVLLTLLGLGRRRRHELAAPNEMVPAAHVLQPQPHTVGIAPLRREVGLGAVLLLAVPAALVQLPGPPARAAEQSKAELPSVPPTMATDLAQRMPDGTLFVPKATQHLLSVRTILTVRAAAPLSVELTGTIVPGPENFGRVQPGRPGRIDAPSGGLAYIGKAVRKGDLLAYVQTYIEAADRANIDSLIAETEARIEKNRTILSRYERSPGSVPQVKVDEVRGELDALTRKRAELVPSLSRREPVVAPINGVVSLANATIGQIVDARDILFEVIDPSQLWIEAYGHGQEASVLDRLTAATAMVGRSRQVPLQFLGRGLALRNQASVYSFKIAGSTSDLSIGMPVKVTVQSSAAVEGIILPASAIVRGGTGLPIVWSKTEPERFEPLNVKIDPLDGQSVVVTSGLKEDLRIVTDGVTLLNQVR